jgi:hypothetical protein
MSLIKKRLEETAAAWPHHKEQLILGGRPGALTYVEERFMLLNARIAELSGEMLVHESLLHEATSITSVEQFNDFAERVRTFLAPAPALPAPEALPPVEVTDP